MKRILVTGGAGFIGHHFVEHLLQNTDWEIVVLDRLSLPGGLARLQHLKGHRLRFVGHDFQFPLGVVASQLGQFDIIVHMGAESHVDTSISEPGRFVFSNVVGTFNMLEFARTQDRLERYVQISTDEVYGPAPDGVKWEEWDRLFPSNPYSATKAAGDCLALSHAVTYGLPVLVTRTLNNFGERQDPCKFLPLIMQRLIQGEPITVHGTPESIGSRHWLHARNHADALLFLLNSPKLTAPDIVNISGDVERTNLEMVEHIAGILEITPEVEYVDFHLTRPGHDRRYALDGRKLRELGWNAPVPFASSLERVVHWTMAHPEWIGASREAVHQVRERKSTQRLLLGQASSRWAEAAVS